MRREHARHSVALLAPMVNAQSPNEDSGEHRVPVLQEARHDTVRKLRWLPLRLALPEVPRLQAIPLLWTTTRLRLSSPMQEASDCEWQGREHMAVPQDPLRRVKRQIKAGHPSTCSRSSDALPTAEDTNVVKACVS